MVKSGLVDRVEVSQYRLVAHLGLALLLYAAIVWTALDLLRPRSAAALAAAGLRRAAGLLVALIFLTVLAGGFVAGLHAGLIYNTFPLMDGRLVPAGYAALSPWWLNGFENVAAVQFDHRVLAMTTLASVVVFVVVAARRRDLSPYARHAVAMLLALVLLQVALGIATLLLVVPIPFAAAHQAGAVLLLTASLAARHALGGSAGR
jgi:cytochrome c oxidase assembly protein subunit 15